MKEERKPCTYAHEKWFYGQSERAYYLNYFVMKSASLVRFQAKMMRTDIRPLFKLFTSNNLTNNMEIKRKYFKGTMCVTLAEENK